MRSGVRIPPSAFFILCGEKMMIDELVVVGELHQDLYYESNFYEDLVNKIVDKLINFIRYNPDDLLNRKLLSKIIKSGFSDTSKKILSNSKIKRGGNGNNSAEALAKLGIPVKLVSVIGKGVSWMIDELDKIGIDTKYIYQIDEKNPISTIIKSNFTTKIYLAPNLKEKMNFKRIDLKNSLFEDAKIIFITPFAEKYNGILEKVSKLNKITAITIEYQKIKKIELLRKLIKEKTGLLFINLDDAKLILGDEEIKKIDSKLKKFSDIRVYTDGKNGSYIYSDNISEIFISSGDVKVIDRTGAGDSYAAGFLAKFYEFFENKNQLKEFLSSEKKNELVSKLKDCGKHATYTAMYKISHQNLPTEKELEEFITELNNE